MAQSVSIYDASLEDNSKSFVMTLSGFDGQFANADSLPVINQLIKNGVPITINHVTVAQMEQSSTPVTGFYVVTLDLSSSGLNPSAGDTFDVFIETVYQSRSKFPRFRLEIEVPNEEDFVVNV